jgi:sorbitol/mannitol transport system substrate-binding protein
MQQMEQPVGTFEKENPGITVKFDTLPEDQKRAEICLPATPSHRCGGSFMSYLRFRPRVFGAIGCAAALVAVAACSSGSTSGSGSSSGVVTVAVVSNPLITGQMIPLAKSNFEKQNPGITVKFATYTEADLRAAIEKDVSTHTNSFNVIMIGPYETPLFAKNGWLDNLSTQFIAHQPSYDASDLLPPIAKSLSYKNDLYAVPFYGESSMLYYRKDLFAKAGITMPLHPTWAQVQGFAAKLNQPGKVAGVCLRGLAGWGDNMASLDTVINTFGGEWFNEKWQPQLTSPADVNATNFYVNLIRKYGENGASNDSFNQLLTLYGQGKCAMWYDATVAATSITGSYPAIAAKTGYAFAPVDRTKSSGWLWTWSLGIPKGVNSQSDAWKFVSWATSKSYDRLVAAKYGWAAVPPGTRTSLYNTPQYKQAAKAFAGITLASIDSTDPLHPTVNPVPYVGVQFVDIPQFETLGVQVGQQIAGAIAGTETVSQALKTSQSDASAFTPQQLAGG